MGKFKVITIPPATCGRRVLMALEEKGATYQLQTIDFRNLEHKTPEYLSKHQPFGQIPVFYDGDIRIFESRAICRYIDDVVPGHQLVPKDPVQKALVEQWISIEMCHFIAAENIVYEFKFKAMFGLKTDFDVVDENKKKLDEFMKVFDAHLEGKSFIVGDDFTLAGT